MTIKDNRIKPLKVLSKEIKTDLRDDLYQTIGDLQWSNKTLALKLHSLS
jgi:hypothetical protein